VLQLLTAYPQTPLSRCTSGCRARRTVHHALLPPQHPPSLTELPGESLSQIRVTLAPEKPKASGATAAAGRSDALLVGVGIKLKGCAEEVHECRRILCQWCWYHVRPIKSGWSWCIIGQW
jgi:hypothetical protein